MDLKRTKKERTAVRTAFTKIHGKISSCLDESGVSDDVTGQIELLREKQQRLSELDNLILSTMFEDDSQDDVDGEIESADHYKTLWHTLWSKYQRLLNKGTNSTTSKTSSIPNTTKGQPGRRQVKLPKIELVKFDGEIRNWLSFWCQFSKIHDDASLDDHDKFQYLLGAIPAGTPARSVIESFPPSAQNYRSAIDHLTQRFGREDLLIEVYTRDLLNLVLLQSKQDQAPSLSSLYDKLTTQLRALETLGLTNDKVAAMLYPLVESALPGDVLKAWEREHRSREKGKPERGKALSALLEFLKEEVESSQRIDLAKTFVTDNTNSELAGVATRPQPTTSCFVANEKAPSTKTSDVGCIWCNRQSHSSIQCYKAAGLSLEQKKQHIKKAKACAFCLKIGHNSFKCRSPIKCPACLKRHNVLLCPELAKVNKTTKGTETEKANTTESSMTVNLGHNTQRFSVTLLQTLLVKIIHKGQENVVRALIDSGAQKSYIKRELADRIGLPVTGEKRIGHIVFGGIETEQTIHKVYDVTIASLDDTFQFSMKVLDEEKICGALPRVYECDLLEKLWKCGVTLTDVGRHIPEVSLLIGADFCGMLLTSDIVQIGDGLTAIRTTLGWTVQGVKYNNQNSSILTTSLHIADLWDLETLGIMDPVETKCRREIEEEVMAKFESSIKTNDEMRYEVTLPWKEGHSPLLSNRRLAERRLLSTTKRLAITDNFEAYDKVFGDWEKLGIIEEVNNDENNGHYLAHHAVIKESSATTRVRPVFDASARDLAGNSLNSCLEKGVNLLELIPKLLTQFRLNPVGVTADIEKAFLQISLVSSDRDFLKFLWWTSKERQKMKVYRHCRVVFGLTCSPFLLGATIKHHLQQAPPALKDTADKLLKSFYVDNCVVSLAEEEVDKFVSQARELMKQGKFNLREWVISPLKGEKPEKEYVSVLGMIWNTSDDKISINVNMPTTIPTKLTRRTLLSVAQRVFDPIGYTAPTTLIPKLLMQKAWDIQGGWDDELPEQISKEFLKWWEHVHLLTECRIPRRLTEIPRVTSSNISLHVFSDASLKSYGSCVFLRAEKEGKVTVQLVLAKARVAPSKQKVTIPRLELIAALIATRLCIQAREALQLECPTHYWTDSTIALTWIKKESQWAVFVQNRVKEIRTNSDKESWRFIPGTMNPADLPSRGCDPKTLLQSIWWEGPQWLKLNEKDWPQNNVIDDNQADIELRKSSYVNLNVNKSDFSEDLLYFSKYSKILRMFTWILRFVSKISKRNNETGELTCREIELAERELFKIIQKEAGYVSNKWQGSLSVTTDDHGLMRVQTKLLLLDEVEGFKRPVLLPGNHRIVERLVQQKHETLCHAGTGTIMTVLREQFWIIGVRRLSKKIISRCGKCKRFKLRPCSVPFAPLPTERLNKYAAVFETCGIDYAGPLFLKSGEKAYIVLFTCAVYRAIHLELTMSLTTEDFIMALRRFIARRGRVSKIYTDNGTNFVGTSNLLKDIDWSAVQGSVEIQPIKWVFNPPSGAWWGGWWERLVRSVKELLRRVLGRSVVTFIELETVLCDCEAVINARPLTYVTESDILAPITPNNFLQCIPRNDVPDLDLINEKSLNQRVQYVQKLRQDLRQRFRSEYISQLVQRGKEKMQELKVGDVVLIETQDKRVNWPLGLVIETFKGKDGHSRVAKLRMASGGELTRPYQRLYPLELQSQGENPVVTRSGRVVRVPGRFHLGPGGC